MTRHKDFKLLVRARMRRTGENYLTARAELLAEPAAEDGAAQGPAYAAARREQQVIIDRWIRDGRLVAIPARRKVRAAVLLEVLSRLEPGRIYPEVELSRRLGRLHEDFAYLRRELVAFGYLQREAGRYWVCTEPPVRLPHQRAELPAWEWIWLPGFIGAAPDSGERVGRTDRTE